MMQTYKQLFAACIAINYFYIIEVYQNIIYFFYSFLEKCLKLGENLNE